MLILHVLEDEEMKGSRIEIKRFLTQQIIRLIKLSATGNY